MNQREKLIELIIESVQGCARYWAEIIADHLIENGVIVPPCNAGDRIYKIFKRPSCAFVGSLPLIVEPQQIIYKNVMGHYSCIPFDDFNKTVFLTREEAEKALAKRSGE